MPVCTFFGHHDCPPEIKPILREVLTELIEKRNVDMFYVGNSDRTEIDVGASRGRESDTRMVRYSSVSSSKE